MVSTPLGPEADDDEPDDEDDEPDEQAAASAPAAMRTPNALRRLIA
jgi:hypothetical protein